MSQKKSLQTPSANSLFDGGSRKSYKIIERSTVLKPFNNSNSVQVTSEKSLDDLDWFNYISGQVEDQAFSEDSTQYYLQKEIQEQFTPKKKQSQLLAFLYDEMHDSGDIRVSSARVKRCEDCGSFLGFAKKEEGYKLTEANFCRDRLCPMCQRRRSLKMFAQVSQCMDYLFSSKSQFGKLKFAFLTLTCGTCSDDDLPETIALLLDGFRKMTDSKLRKLFRSGVIAGSFRSLEIKHCDEDSKTPDFWHPHLHVILALTQTYFGKGFYLSQKEWSSIWAECIDAEYNPIIDIRMIRNYQKEKTETVTLDDLKKSVAECAKYSVKGSDFLSPEDIERSKHLVSVLLDSISGRRLFGFTGCFQKARKALNLDDIEEGDLVHTDGQEINSEIVYEMKRYHWNGYGYTLVE